MLDWLVPWLIACALIWPLQQLENWMHKHLQGMGLLLTNNDQAAVLVYYLLLLPGVGLHELTQWLLAKGLRVPIKKFQLWPEKIKGKIHLGLVEIEDTDLVRATVIGMLPVLVGVAVIALIASRFDIAALGTAMSSGDLATMTAGLGAFIATPDFWLWIYLIFAVANAMLPEDHDVINWWYLIVPVGVVMLCMMLIDLGILGRSGVIFDFAYIVKASFEQPIAQAGQYFAVAMGISVAVDLLVMGIVSAIEAIFSRVLDRELEYS
jgi:hypothetical protein